MARSSIGKQHYPGDGIADSRIVMLTVRKGTQSS